MGTEFIDHSEEVLKALEEALTAAMKECSEIAVKDAQRKVPVATGRLRDSIQSDSSEEGFTVGTDVTYAPYVEDGTSRQKAHHYLRNSVADNADTYKKIIETHLKG